MLLSDALLLLFGPYTWSMRIFKK
uniref:DNA-directed RNA polymerase n=1 Tax=Rhizophora mucronata TaxID=61149 RepID=A0A2P2MP48_RHIMU